MTRSSPAVRRVAAILNFIASHPGQAFTLTDLVRALKLSRGTCHALLMGLVEVGYLYRASDKQYVLGPALVAIGRNAAQHAAPLQIAQPEMRALADEFDALCSACTLEDHDVIIAERAASVSNLGPLARPGTRMRIRPVAVGVFFARASQRELEAWLDEATPAVTADQRASLKKVMTFLREHGFTVHVSDLPVAKAQAGASLGHYEDSNVPIAVLTELEAKRRYDLLAITAPVFDANGSTVFVLSLSGLPSPTSGADILRIGARLREACDRVSEYITGGRPKRARLAF
jgi:DNA-binding IclR family transcriptional regulator